MADRRPFRLDHWLQYRVVRVIVWLLLRLPYTWRVPACGWLVAWVVAPFAGYRSRIRENLALVMPDLPRSEVRRLMRAVPDNLGRSLIEQYSGTEFTARTQRAAQHGPGLAVLKAAHAAKRPVVLVSGHFGNYDAFRAHFVALGYPVGAIYRPMNNQGFNDHYIGAMLDLGKPLFARDKKGMGLMLRHVRAGGMIAVLIDQHMAHGARLKFFGRDASTALSAADIALKYDAPMICGYATRLPNGLDFDMWFDAPIPPSTPEIMTQAANDSLEAQIRKHPDQWLWVHRRWKL